MHEIPSPLFSQVPVGLEAAYAANTAFDELTLLRDGYYGQLYAPEEVAAAAVAHKASFDTLVTAAGNLVGQPSLLASKSIRDQQLYLAGTEVLCEPALVLPSEAQQTAIQSDGELIQIAENRAKIRDKVNEAFQPYIQAFLNKKPHPHPNKKPRRLTRDKAYSWHSPGQGGSGHKLTMHYREDPKGTHMTRIDCLSLAPQTAVDAYNNNARRQKNPRASSAALFPPYIVSCQFENGEPVELSLNWPPGMFNSTYLHTMGRIGNLIGRSGGNAELRQPCAVLHTIGSKAEDTNKGRTQITLDLRGDDPTIALKKTPSSEFTNSTLARILLGSDPETPIGGYTYNPQTDQFVASGMPYPTIQGTGLGVLAADILRYFPTLQEQSIES